jgi:FkbM family methyltransferase
LNLLSEEYSMAKTGKVRQLAKKIPFAVQVVRFVRQAFRSMNDDLHYVRFLNRKIIEIQGSKMYLDLWEKDRALRRTFRAYASSSVHEQSTTQLLRSILNPGDVFVDLGANIGYFTLLAASIVGRGGKVYSFEPEPRNFSLLSRNVSLNNYSHCPYDTGHHTMNQSNGITDYESYVDYDKSAIRKVPIDTISLDEFLDKEKQQQVALVKVDVEGAEGFALKGMRNTIQNNEDIRIIMEFFPLFIEKMGCDPRQIIDMVTNQYGLKIFQINADYYAQTTSLELFSPIEDIDRILDFYKGNERYHINLLLMRKTL